MGYRGTYYELTLRPGILNGMVHLLSEETLVGMQLKECLQSPAIKDMVAMITDNASFLHDAQLQKTLQVLSALHFTARFCSSDVFDATCSFTPGRDERSNLLVAVRMFRGGKGS